MASWTPALKELLLRESSYASRVPAFLRRSSANEAEEPVVGVQGDTE